MRECGAGAVFSRQAFINGSEGAVPDTFYWYDLETSGTEPRWDRIVQFAGLRTDRELNEIGEPWCTYVHLPDDVLPSPGATLVTGITPQLAREQGIPEWRALRRIDELFREPNTCVAGYNNLRFDDEFVRYGLYRNLMDPYAREWQNGNSRWDIIDLVRAAGALRPDGIEWPVDEEGLPVYRLEALTAANGLEQDNPHDALSDTRATVALARLIRQRQPKLFAYHFAGRFKRRVRELLEPAGARLCVHVSGMYPRQRKGLAPIVSVCRHPANSNSIVVADLGEDIEMLLDWPVDRIREALFTANAPVRPPLKEIRINKCPFVALADVVTEADAERLQFDRALARQRMRRLERPGIARKIQKVYARGAPESQPDVDAALYEGFLKDADKARCESFHRELAGGRWVDLDYRDKRLEVLASRLKSRGFSDRQDAGERDGWHAWVRDKLGAADAPWRTLRRFESELDEALESATGRRQELLFALKSHGEALQATYRL